MVLEDDKERLADIRAAVRERLAADRLRLHPHKAHMTRAADGFNLLAISCIRTAVFCETTTATASREVSSRWRKPIAPGGWNGRTSWPRFRVGSAMPNMRTRRVFAGRSSPRLCSPGERAKRRPACDPGRFLEQQSGEPACIEPEQEPRRQPEQQHRLPSCPVHPHGKLPGPEPVCSRTGRARQRVSMSLLPGLPRRKSRREGLG